MMNSNGAVPRHLAVHQSRPYRGVRILRRLPCIQHQHLLPQHFRSVQSLSPALPGHQQHRQVEWGGQTVAGHRSVVYSERRYGEKGS